MHRQNAKKGRSYDADSSKCKLYSQHGPRLEQILAEHAAGGQRLATAAWSVWWKVELGWWCVSRWATQRIDKKGQVFKWRWGTLVSIASYWMNEMMWKVWGYETGWTGVYGAVLAMAQSHCTPTTTQGGNLLKGCSIIQQRCWKGCQFWLILLLIDWHPLTGT